MLTSTKVTGIGYQLDGKTNKYVINKIGKLDRFLPRHARRTASAEVRIKQRDGSSGVKYEIEAQIDVPEKMILAKSSGLHVFTAIDEVESKLAAQLRKYKQSQVAHIGRRRILSRFKRSYAREL
ncbi:MAG TPA: ribosome-associated translation inhibitor RaiA [Candidatus Saccharibacteria bacterium]|nr:ribosome-associated translation inhibitor RaiA [Candidatus Saccharibacteria bacterium]HRQ98137.1 ribosome-associated translation inhibitor RaiA [Candidatus Saccharibacteria bacterium]